MLPPQQWAVQEFGEVDLGDERRNRRAVRYAAAAAGAPAASIPRQCGTWAATKAAYGLFKAAGVDFESMVEGHWYNTWQLAGACSVVLLLNDTTTLSFNHPGTEGLGPTSKGQRGQGMLLHSTLAVDGSGGITGVPKVLGLAYQQLWARAHKRQKDQPLESNKWPAAIEAVGCPLPRPGLCLHVADAESDYWATMVACQEQGVGHVLRVSQNRRVVLGHGPAELQDCTGLLELARSLPTLGSGRLYVRSRPGREPREARLQVSAAAVRVFPPQARVQSSRKSGADQLQPLLRWVLRIWEVNGPAEEQPIEWILLTDQPISDAATAWRVGYWYSCRWLIEEYHKCLKTGCQVEARQLEQGERLEPLVGVLSVVAVRLLQLKQQARMHPEEAAEKTVPACYVKMLGAYLQEPEQMSNRRFFREVARLGGFLGRKGDGEPGWLTLWRGWQQLEMMTIGWELARKGKSKRSG
jgi:hypothetical protein